MAPRTSRPCHRTRRRRARRYEPSGKSSAAAPGREDHVRFQSKARADGAGRGHGRRQGDGRCGGRGRWRRRGLDRPGQRRRDGLRKRRRDGFGGGGLRRGGPLRRRRLGGKGGRPGRRRGIEFRAATRADHAGGAPHGLGVEDVGADRVGARQCRWHGGWPSDSETRGQSFLSLQCNASAAIVQQRSRIITAARAGGRCARGIRRERRGVAGPEWAGRRVPAAPALAGPRPDRRHAARRLAVPFGRRPRGRGLFADPTAAAARADPGGGRPGRLSAERRRQGPCWSAAAGRALAADRLAALLQLSQRPRPGVDDRIRRIGADPGPATAAAMPRRWRWLSASPCRC